MRKNFLLLKITHFLTGLHEKDDFKKKERKEKDFLDLFKRQQNILSSSQKGHSLTDLIRLNIFLAPVSPEGVLQ